MILDALDQLDRYAGLNPHFAAAFAYLKQAAQSPPDLGVYEVDGDAVKAIVTDAPGRGHAGAKREYHRDYIDVQYVAEGVDEIGWKPTAECTEVTSAYDAAKDVGLFGDEPSAWVAVPPGCFAILWPEDMHAPLGGDGPLLKVILKVKVA